MKTNKVAHIFFDLDHTLWDFERNSALTFEKIFGELKIDLNLVDFLVLLHSACFVRGHLEQNRFSKFTDLTCVAMTISCHECCDPIWANFIPVGDP